MDMNWAEYLRIVATVAVLALGLHAGAQLAEACLLVPYWRASSPEEFLAWYRRYGRMVFRFFAPLASVSAWFTIAAAVLGRQTPWIVAALLNVAILAMFPVYFKRVNASFENGSIATGAVPAELARWAAWHWIRTVLAITAFVVVVIARE